jgi:hypothetical protein
MNDYQSRIRRRRGRRGWEWIILDAMSNSLVMQGTAEKWKTAQANCLKAKRLLRAQADNERKGHGFGDIDSDDDSDDGIDIGVDDTPGWL